jgi:ribosomal protein S18 acetylase RimI-like enzyme
MKPVHVRKANIEDASRIALVHVRSWQVAYRGHMPDEFLDGLDPEKRAEMWRQLTQNPDKIVLVAEDDENIVGLCAAGASRDPDASPKTAEIGAIYVQAEKWRTGVGRALLSAALEQLRNRQFEEVTLWVLKPNQRARSFYASCGFVPDGAVQDNDDWKTIRIRELRYRLSLRVI